MLWKKATLLGLAGFVMGVLICIGFLLGRFPEDLRAALPHLLMGGIYGAVAMGGSVVYEVEEWSIARCTVTHFLLCFGLYCLIGLSMGWFTPDNPAFWIILSVMVVIYFMIWLIQYMCYKRKIQQLNEELKKLKSKAKNE